MPKLGDVREDGKVFWLMNRGREYWVTKDHFARNFGADWWEKRAASLARTASNKEKALAGTARRLEREKYRLEHQEEIQQRKREKSKAACRRQYWKDPEKARRKALELKRKAPEKAKEAQRRCTLKRKDDPKRRAWIAAYKERKQQENTEKNAGKKEESARLRAEIRAAIDERKRLKEEATRARPVVVKRPKVALTDEQRRQAKRDDKRNYKHRRRALLRGQEAKATPKQIREARQKAKACHYCREKGPLTVDHVKPLAKGGSHTLDNIVFACHRCNSEKRDLDPNEYAHKHGILLV